MHFQATVVLDETQFAKSVHKEADSGARGADNFRERLLANLGNHWLGLAILADIGQQQEHPRQPFFTGIKKLINQILLDANVSGEQMMQP
jgi:hypothetical protein